MRFNRIRGMHDDTLGTVSYDLDASFPSESRTSEKETHLHQEMALSLDRENSSSGSSQELAGEQTVCTGQ